MSDLSSRNRRMGVRLALIVGVMLLVSFASVPLYDLFCKATGFGGTTQVASKAPSEISDRRITIRFNTDVAPGLDWKFKPSLNEINVRLGEVSNVLYKVTNQGGNATGVAVYQVQPERAGLYFNKIQCFCFNQEPLGKGQAAELPVQFFIDSEFGRDPQLEDVKTITLSYTFFPAKSPKLAEAEAAYDAYEKRRLEAIKSQ
jgi:cytochrome c oxidase assembly protein subunit 11